MYWAFEQYTLDPNTRVLYRSYITRLFGYPIANRTQECRGYILYSDGTKRFLLVKYDNDFEKEHV